MTLSRKRILCLIAMWACASMVWANGATAQVVIPNAYTSSLASTSGLNTFIRDSGNPRTGQLLISASELSSVVGQQIVGINFRLWSGATTSFPASTATWSDYEIRVGAGGTFPMSTSFDANFAGTPTLVRDGALTIDAANFIVGPTPRPFGDAPIMFDTPYNYTGGNLTLEVRHSGSNIVNNSANDFLEVALTTDPGNNVNFASMTATGNTATVGALTNFTIAQLIVVPEPTSLTMVGLALGMLGCCRRWMVS